MAVATRCHDFPGSRGGRRAPLPYQRPVVEFLRLLDLRERHGRLDTAGEFQIDNPRLRILRIVAPLRSHDGHPDHARNAAAMINEYAVAPPHLADTSNPPPRCHS